MGTGTKATEESYKKDINNITNGEYEYISGFTKMNKPVKLRHNCEKCNNHEFTTYAGDFKNRPERRKCPKCEEINKIMKKVNKTNIDNNLNYILTDNLEKINFNCKICNNNFDMKIKSLSNHYDNKPPITCPYCDGRLKTREIVANEIYTSTNGEYELVSDYIDNKTLITIRHNCEKCNNLEFETLPTNFTSLGNRCPKCNGNMKFTKEEFINKLNSYSNEYELVSDYLSYDEEIILLHKKCGCTFNLLPKEFFSPSKSRRCPYCKEQSKGEDYIKNYLLSKKIKFKVQKRFSTCKYLSTLPFDFYISHLNLLIEYDGSQHFSESSQFHGNKENFKLRLKCDQIKNQWCKDNKVSLIRISYKDFNNLEKILDDILFQIKNFIQSNIIAYIFIYQKKNYY